MPAACRIGDPISCGDTEAQGSPDVFVNGIPWTRVGPDLTVGHCFNPTPIASGSPNVFINGLPAARVGDPIVPHTCPPIPATHGGSVAAGSPDVFANG
jgi:uncharacterized Zn-binding protein involved in type VI secretion